jgi:hypothetical protein
MKKAELVKILAQKEYQLWIMNYELWSGEVGI